MASGAMLSGPPPQPPDVTAQQGGNPFAGASEMVAQKSQSQQGEQANPQGALVKMKDAIGQVLDQMSKMESGFAPFADRIKALLDAGVGSIMSGGPKGDKPSVQSPSQRPDQGATPGQMSSFPG